MSQRHTISSPSGLSPGGSSSSGIGGMGLVPRSLQLDFEKEKKRVEQFESVNKKFYKDVKAYIEKLDELLKSENKLIANLSKIVESNDASSLAVMNNNSSADQIDTERLKSINELLNEHTRHCDHFKQTCQSSVIDPMKNLSLIFPQFSQAVNKREQSLKELSRLQKQLEKVQEKERTGPNLVKVNELKQSVQIANAQFHKENSVLMDELPKFYASRVDYIRPCVNCLIKSQLDFYEKYKNFYDQVLGKLNVHATKHLKTKSTSPEKTRLNKSIEHHHQRQASQSGIYENIDSDDEINELNEDIQKCLSDIKSLSIVAAD